MTVIELTESEKDYLAELRLAYRDVLGNPDHWNQRDWHCDTSHCLAGFADMRRLNMPPSKAYPYGSTTSPFAMQYPYWGQDAPIFEGLNTLEEIKAELDRIEREGFQFNAEGYDAEGYDRDGLDDCGFDRDLCQ